MVVAKDDKTIPKKHSDNLKKQIKNLKLYKEVEGGHNGVSKSDLVEFIKLCQ